MIISCQNAEKEGKFSFAVCSKGVRSNSTHCHFGICWVHKRCSDIFSKMKVDNNLKCQTGQDHQTLHMISQA